MKSNRRMIIFLIASLILAAVFLHGNVYKAAADAGGWPTETPTPTLVQATAQVVIPPDTSADVNSQNPAIEVGAPLPDVNANNQPALVQQDNLVPDTQQTGGSNMFRIITTIGAIILVVLIIGFVVFRLRS